MHLSRLILNTRTRAARTDLANPYEMHRTLSRGASSESAEERLLWRVDVDRARRPTVIVQSWSRPDWNRLDERSPDYLIRPPETKEFELSIRKGQVLSFRLRANPAVSRDGRRWALPDTTARIEWLSRKGGRAGFRLLGEPVVRDEQGLRMPRGEGWIHLSVATFEGMLAVEHADLLREAVRGGIGPGKALGLGLLSLARPW